MQNCNWNYSITYNENEVEEYDSTCHYNYNFYFKIFVLPFGVSRCKYRFSKIDLVYQIQNDENQLTNAYEIISCFGSENGCKITPLF